MRRNTGPKDGAKMPGMPISVREDETKTKEEKEMLTHLDINPDVFTAGKLAFIEPEKWKNIGVSVIHAC